MKVGVFGESALGWVLFSKEGFCIGHQHAFLIPANQIKKTIHQRLPFLFSVFFAESCD
jgi:hypothetical protein